MDLKNKLKDLLRNFSYTLVSNLVSLIISALVILILPKYIEVEAYGYWQLYIFYTTYIGFLHFGWNDGIYLREGGQDYHNLSKSSYFSQFYILLFSQILIAILGSVLAFLLISDSNKLFVIYSTCVCLVIVNCRYMLLFLLQATNRIKEYSAITIIDRLIYAIAIFLLIINKIYDFRLMVNMDLLGKGLSLLYAIYLCKDIVIQKISAFRFQIKEIQENINSGIKLMFSTIASKLIIGNIRFGIEKMWSIVVFGKISLVLSISGFLMIFINAVGIVLFPFLRKVKEENLPRIYTITRNLLTIILSIFLFLYFPLVVILNSWLPKYQDSLKYLAIVFPMCLYESKMSMLIGTYLKVMRQEKVLLIINLVSLCLSVILGLITIYFLRNLDLAVLSIIFLVAVRSILAEIFICKKLNIKMGRSIIFEIVLTIGFIFCCWVLSYFESLIGYLLIFIFFLIFNLKSIRSTLTDLRKIIK